MTKFEEGDEVLVRARVCSYNAEDGVYNVFIPGYGGGSYRNPVSEHALLSLPVPLSEHQKAVVEAAKAYREFFRPLLSDAPDMTPLASPLRHLIRVIDAAIEAERPKTPEAAVDAVLLRRGPDLVGGWAGEAGVAQLRNEIVAGLRNSGLLNEAEEGK